ncbi:MAG: PKD domain-containing protein [Candidatus Omnitrophica bacterium]|nr:PKD domain-containing protein [Candidatus Omnitrophota bacterium]
MKRFVLILLAVLTLSGCATYQFQTGQPPYDKGYVVERAGQPIVDYTVGKDNTVPSDLKLAVERFYRRRDTVEAYYKKMGEMEGRFKEVFINPPIAIVQFIGGFFRLPYIYYSNKKYENDPKYRKEVDRIEKERLDAELARKKAIRDELNAYIQKDLEKEPALVKEPEVVEIKTEEVKAVPEKGEEVIVKEEIKEPKASAETSLDVNASVAVEPEEPAVAEKVVAEPVTKEKIATEPVVPVDKIAAEPVVEKSETTSQVIEKTVKPQAQSPVVIIIAKPTKGYSPLRVKFYGHKSYSRGSRIVNYQWDFGDGTTSNKKDFVNTYWSVSYGSRNFPVTLTVTDNHGNTATATTVIEVKSK